MVENFKAAQMTKHQHSKELYIKGMSISDIARTLCITRATIYAYRKKDLEAGVEWDDLALANARDVSGVKMSEKEFLTTLIKSFESALETIGDKEPIEKLQILKEFSTTYYKLKAPIKTDCKSQVLDAITKTIYEISQIALEENDTTVANFLSTKADIIINRTIKR